VLVGACPNDDPGPGVTASISAGGGSNCSRLWMDHMVSVHTGGADMSNYAAEAGNVQRFLGVMALLAGSFEPSLETLAARLHL